MIAKINWKIRVIRVASMAAVFKRLICGLQLPSLVFFLRMVRLARVSKRARELGNATLHVDVAKRLSFFMRHSLGQYT